MVLADGGRVRCGRCTQPHQIPALLGVLHAQREGSPFIGQGFVHGLEEHKLMAPVFGNDFRCCSALVLLRAIFQPLGQKAPGQALPQLVNLALQAMRPSFAVFGRDTAVRLIETGDSALPMLKQTAPQNRHINGAGLARAQGLKTGIPFGMEGLGLGVGLLEVGGLERGTDSPPAGEVGAEVFGGTEAELVDAGIGTAMYAGESGHGSGVHTVTLHGLPGHYLWCGPRFQRSRNEKGLADEYLLTLGTTGGEGGIRTRGGD